MSEDPEPPARADGAGRPPPPLSTGGSAEELTAAVMTKPGSKRRAMGCGVLILCLFLLLGVASFLAANFIISVVRGAATLKSANRLLWSRQFADAVPLYSAALKDRLQKRDRALAYGNRGWAYANLDRDPDAINDFNAALAIDPDLVFALLDRGLAFHRQGKFGEAQADYDRVIALAPNTLDAYRNRSMILAHLGRLKEAIADLDEAVRCDPSNPNWFARRGCYCLRDGNLEAARANYESALRLDPEDEEAYRGRAILFARQHDSQRGVEEVSEAIRQHPDSARLFYARGLVHLDLLEPKEALEDFDAAILLRGKSALAYTARAAAEIWLERFEAGLGDVLQAINLAPKFSTPHYLRGRAYAKQHIYKEAIAEYDRAIACDSEAVWAMDHRALTEAAAESYDNARRDLEQTTQRFPGTFEAHMYRAWFLATCPKAEYRNGSTALTEAQLAVQLSYEDPYALDTLAAAYAEIGDFERAQEEERKALAKMPAPVPDRKEMEARLEGFGQEKPYRDNR